jgi:hydroxyacylglutathione hydrolase
MALVRLERQQRAGTALAFLALLRGDANASLDDDDPRALVYLVVAELLSGSERDHNRPGRVVGGENDGIARACGCVDLRQVPPAHEGEPTARRYTQTPVTLVVDRYELGPVGTNCYVVRAVREVRDAVVVDPGSDATQIRLELARLGVTCAAILITHCHYDHIGAVADLAEATGAPVHVAADEQWVLEQADQVYGTIGIRIRPYAHALPVADGETLRFGDLAFEAVLVPGHSPAHLAYHADDALFSGDVLFAGGVGRVDLPGGDWETLLGSIRLLSERYPPETVVYPGHGPPTTLGTELLGNPFLTELRA